MNPVGRRLRPTPLESAYVLLVTTVAVVGFATGLTPVILLSALIALPASVVALPGYYVAYGLLALAPGANPDTSTGSGGCSPDGHCSSVSTGDPALWFTVAGHSAGVLAMCGAAVLNVVLLRHLVAVRRARSSRAA